MVHYSVSGPCQASGCEPSRTASPQCAKYQDDHSVTGFATQWQFRHFSRILRLSQVRCITDMDVAGIESMIASSQGAKFQDTRAVIHITTL